MKKILSLFLVVGSVLPLNSMQLQLQEAEGASTLRALEEIATKTIPQAFCKELETTGYNFVESRNHVEIIIADRPGNIQTLIKNLFCKKYHALDMRVSPELLGNIDRFDRILFKKALAEAFIVNNSNALNKLFASEHIREFFAESEIEKLRKHYSSEQFPSLLALSFKAVAEKTVPMAFEQKLEETGYDYDEAIKWVGNILSSVSNGVDDAHKKAIKELFCKKYGGNIITHKILTGHDNWVNSAVFSPDGKTIASASCDKTMKIWNAETGQCLHTLNGHNNSVDSAVFSPDGKTIASASYDNTIKIWNAETGQCLRTLTDHNHDVYSVVFSPDGKTIASASWDKTIKIWGAETGQCLHTLTGHDNWVNSAVFSPDGKSIASASRDKTIKIWDAETGQCLRTLTDHNHDVYSVVFSPDGKTIASASRDKTIKIWDAETGQCLHTLTGNNPDVNSVVFSPDGKSIASASRDKTVRIWKHESFDRILFKKALAEAAGENNTNALKQLFSTEEIQKLFTVEEIKTLRENYFPEDSFDELPEIHIEGSSS